MSRLDTWSTTAAQNNTAAPNGFPEGMKASDFNNGMREVMAQVRTAWEENDWRNLYGTTDATYLSATTFSVPDTYQTEFVAGRRLRLTVNGVENYGQVVSESTSVGTTTVTVAMDSGDAIDANLTEVYFGPDVESYGNGIWANDEGANMPHRLKGPLLSTVGDIFTGQAFDSHTFDAAAPQGWFQAGVSGSAWTPSSATEFIVENDGDLAMVLVSPNTDSVSLFFGDEDDEDVGGFTYNHATNHLEMRTAGAKAITVHNEKTLETAADGTKSQPALEVNGAGGLYYDDPNYAISLTWAGTDALKLADAATYSDAFIWPDDIYDDVRVYGGPSTGAVSFQIRPYTEAGHIQIASGSRVVENDPALLTMYGVSHATRSGDIDLWTGDSGTLSVRATGATSDNMTLTDGSVAFDLDGSSSSFSINLDGGQETLTWDASDGILHLEPSSFVRSLATYANTNGGQAEGDGNMYITDSGTIWRSTSSRQYKENIRHVSPEDGLTALRELRPARYNRVGNAYKALGFIAEEVHEAIPESKFLSDDFANRSVLAALWSAAQSIDMRLTAVEAVHGNA